MTHEILAADARLRDAMLASAVVAVRTTIAVTFGGVAASGVFRFTQVWHRGDDGAWRVVAGHSCQVI